MNAKQNLSFMQMTLYKFKKNLLGVVSLSIVCFFGILAIFAYFITPDNTQNANQMHLNIAYAPMAFKVKTLQIPLDNYQEDNKFSLTYLFNGFPKTVDEIAIREIHFYEDFISYKTFQKSGDALAKKISYQAFEKHNILKKNIKDNFIQTKTFWLGTDKYGRDFLSRLIIGTRISFSVGFIAIFISLVIGLFIGALGGYYRGWVDNLIMWLINVIWSIPTLLMVIAITLALGKGFWQVFFAVGLTMWVEVARIIRGQFMGEREQEYVEAAKALGYSDFRIMLKHILPNTLGPVIVISAANFAAAILIESGLSFLGIGAQPPIPSWGSIIKEHYANIILGHTHLAVVPGLCIMVLVLAFILIGNSLRDIFDIKNNS